MHAIIEGSNINQEKQIKEISEKIDKTALSEQLNLINTNISNEISKFAEQYRVKFSKFSEEDKGNILKIMSKFEVLSQELSSFNKNSSIQTNNVKEKLEKLSEEGINKKQFVQEIANIKEDIKVTEQKQNRKSKEICDKVVASEKVIEELVSKNQQEVKDILNETNKLAERIKEEFDVGSLNKLVKDYNKLNQTIDEFRTKMAEKRDINFVTAELKESVGVLNKKISTTQLLIKNKISALSKKTKSDDMDEVLQQMDMLGMK